MHVYYKLQIIYNSNNLQFAHCIWHLNRSNFKFPISYYFQFQIPFTYLTSKLKSTTTTNNQNQHHSSTILNIIYKHFNLISSHLILSYLNSLHFNSSDTINNPNKTYLPPTSNKHGASRTEHQHVDRRMRITFDSASRCEQHS